MLAFGETLDEVRANAREEIEAWIDEEAGSTRRTVRAIWRRSTAKADGGHIRPWYTLNLPPGLAQVKRFGQKRYTRISRVCASPGAFRRVTGDSPIQGKLPDSGGIRHPYPIRSSYPLVARVIHWTLVMVKVIPAIHWTLVMRNLDFGDDYLDFGDANRPKSGLSTGLW
jgi:hypothetical protein